MFNEICINEEMLPKYIYKNREKKKKKKKKKKTHTKFYLIQCLTKSCRTVFLVLYTFLLYYQSYVYNKLNSTYWTDMQAIYTVRIREIHASST